MITSKYRRLLELANQYLQKGKGSFAFSGGTQSPYYFDGRMLTLSAEGCALVGELVWEQIVGLSPYAVGGPTLGAAPIVTATQMVSKEHGIPLNGFLVREAAKEHGTQRQVEGYLSPRKGVVIVDDVASTGTSIFRAIDAAEYLECRVLGVIALLDWQLGGGEKLREAGYDFRPFLIGDLPTGKLSLWTPPGPS